MDLQTVIDSTPTLKKPRRNHTDEFKLQLIQQAQQPGESVAKVAMQYQVNANLLHKWIRQNKSDTPQSEQQTDFLPVVLQTTPIKEETFSPTIPARKVPVRIKINPQHLGKSVEIEYEMESTTELLLLVKELAK